MFARSATQPVLTNGRRPRLLSTQHNQQPHTLTSEPPGLVLADGVCSKKIAHCVMHHTLLPWRMVTPHTLASLQAAVLQCCHPHMSTEQTHEYLRKATTTNLPAHKHKHTRHHLLSAALHLHTQVLTKGGFPSKARPRRGHAWVSDTSAVTAKRQQKLERLHKTTQDLVVAWGLSLLCGLGHLGHVWTGAPAWVHALHHPVLAATMSAAALIGESK